MKLYIHRILILFFLLFEIGVLSDNMGIATIYACDLEDEVDNWDLNDFDYDDEIHKGHDEDGNMTGLFGYECVGDSPSNDDDYDDDDDEAEDDDPIEDAPDADSIPEDNNIYDDWDDDPCAMGDCDDLYDDMDDKEDPKEEKEEDDCDPETGIKGTARRVKGKDECVQDCMGVWGGKAYTKVCNGETICIDGNNGTFTNTLTGEALEKFEQVEEEMQQNCLRTSLMNNLNEHYGIQIGYAASQQYPGSFNPCNYSIVFSSIGGIDVYSVSAELFHAYQEQYLDGVLDEILNSLDHRGGSNIEAEEKAFGLLCNNFTLGVGTDECYVLLNEWYQNFFDKYEYQHSNITLTEQEQQSWFEAVEEFRECNQGKFQGTLYDAPVDETLLPTTLLDLWSHAEDCSDGFVVRPINGKTIIISNRWKRLQ